MYVPLCYILLILDVYFYPFVFLFIFIKLSSSKISFPYSLEVTILISHVAPYHVALVLDVCRFHPIPEKYSRLLKAVGLGKEKRTEIPRCLLCMRHWVRSFHNYYFMFLILFYDVEARVKTQ